MNMIHCQQSKATCLEFASIPSYLIPLLAVGNGSKVEFYQIDEFSNTPVFSFTRHRNEVTFMRYCSVYGFMISIDSRGIFEFWNCTTEFEFPKQLGFKSKLDSEFMKFVKEK
jgi:hypothetical protein